MTRALRPRLSQPFTLIAEGDVVHLIGGEDVRYTVQAGEQAVALVTLLNRCDGRSLLSELLAPFSNRDQLQQLLDRLQGERILLDGPIELAHRPGRYCLTVQGGGPLAERLAGGDGAQSPMEVLCQDSLDYHTARTFNRRCLRGRTPWLWVTTGPASRAYVSPVFLPDAGPCLACLLGHFQRLSPVPSLYDALTRHGEQGGVFTSTVFPVEGMAILEAIIRWKVAQMSQATPPSAVYRLHVLELDTMTIDLQHVFHDPTCAECIDARMV